MNDGEVCEVTEKYTVSLFGDVQGHHWCPKQKSASQVGNFTLLWWQHEESTWRFWESLDTNAEKRLQPPKCTYCNHVSLMCFCTAVFLLWAFLFGYFVWAQKGSCLGFHSYIFFFFVSFSVFKIKAVQTFFSSAHLLFWVAPPFGSFSFTLTSPKSQLSKRLAIIIFNIFGVCVKICVDSAECSLQQQRRARKQM